MNDTIKLQILHTSDVHGYVFPRSYSTMKKQDIGIAKLASLIKQYRNDNTLLIDSGDTIQGSPLTFFHSKEKQDDINPMALIYNAMKYDYIAIGNHEFNYGLKYLNNYLNHLDAKIVNCNLLNSQTNEPYKGITHDIFTHDNGPRVGIIGVTTHYIPNWEQPSHIENFTIIDAFESVKKYIKKIKDDVDFIIVNYHGGFERDFSTWELTNDDTGENQGSKMLKEIPEIDLLLTGHQHRLLNGEIFNTHYSQPGFNAQTMSKINIEFKYTDKWEYSVVSNEILSTKKVEPDQLIMDLILNEENETQKYLDTPVGTMDYPLLINNQLEARLNKHPLVSLINHIQLEYTNADISSCSLGNEVSGFRKNITIRDVIGTYIFPNTLVVKQLTGHIVKQSLEKTAEFFAIKDNEIIISDEFNTPKLQLYAYDMYDGIEYTIKVSNPIGSRITSLTKDGVKLDLDAEYSIVMNNYRSSGGGDYFFIKECPIIKDTQTEVIELLITYIVRNKHIKIPHKNNIKVIK